jgi:mono/diheme cytochrome c family protein
MRRALIAAVLGAAVAVALPVLAGAREDLTNGSRVGAPTYYGQVGPILDAHCASCHVDGGVAPFALTSASEARRYARAIAAIVKTGAMPPWPPGRDSAAFVGQGARVLSPGEKATLAAWAAAGAPAGRPRALPRPRPAALPSGARVLRLAPARTYMPKAPGGGFDDYHCFLLDPKLKQDAYLTGALIRPEAASLVHHVILFEAAGPQAAAATRLNRQSGGKGWTCFGGPGLPNDFDAAGSSLRFGAPQWIAAWVPGHVTNTLPSGLGVLLHRGAKIVMQVHYNLIKGAKPDRSTAVLTTAPAAAHLKQLETMLVAAPVELPCPRGASGPLCGRTAAIAAAVRKYGTDAALIPAGLLFVCRKALGDYPQDVGGGRSIGTSCDRRITQPMTLYGVAGHMHLRGRDVSVVLDPGTQKQRTLLHIPAWDFRWQDVYFLQRPIALAPGDTVRLSCRFDNSLDGQPLVGSKPLAPRYVVWGEGTTDEMCLGVLSVSLG